jgi:DNA-damage-inducible protein D
LIITWQCEKCLLRGVKPEQLPAAEDLKKVQRRLESDEKKVIKDAKKKK